MVKKNHPSLLKKKAKKNKTRKKKRRLGFSCSTNCSKSTSRVKIMYKILIVACYLFFIHYICFYFNFFLGNKAISVNCSFL